MSCCIVTTTTAAAPPLLGGEATLASGRLTNQDVSLHADAAAPNTSRVSPPGGRVTPSPAYSSGHSPAEPTAGENMPPCQPRGGRSSSRRPAGSRPSMASTWLAQATLNRSSFTVMVSSRSQRIWHAQAPGRSRTRGTARSQGAAGMDQEQVPVIVGVGEIADQPADIEAGLEPAADGGGASTGRGGWRRQAATVPELARDHQRDLLAVPRPGRPGGRAARPPAETGRVRGGRRANTRGPIGQAALRIAAGESEVVAVCGAEAAWTVTKAAQAGITLPWPDHDEAFVLIRSGRYQRDAARRLGVSTPPSA